MTKKSETDITREDINIYQKMVEEIADYEIIMLDDKGIIKNWNRGAELIKGYAPEDIIGRHFSIFYLPEDLASNLPERLIAQARESGHVTQEGWRKRKDGSRFWGSITITAIHNDEGDVIGFSKVTRDLTAKKVAEEKLKMSEERYHKMVAEVQDYAIILLDENGIIQNWNAGAQKIKGYASSEIVGRSFETFYSEEDQKKGLPKKLLEKARTQGRSVHEGWRIRKDGSRFWGAVVITALHGKDDEVIGFSKVTRDLTERKSAEDKLRLSEERYHKMIAEVQDYAIILLNENGIVQNWNAGAEKIKGYTADEIVGQSFEKFYTPEDQKSSLPAKLLNTAKEEGKAVQEGWRVRKDGTKFWGSVVITALHTSDGHILGYSKVTRDLTQQKMADDKLNAYTRELELQNSELEQFAYVASHDLQEPLRKIRTFAGLIQSNFHNEEFVKRYFEKLDSSARRLSELVRSLLEYSRISRDVNGKRGEAENVDLNEVLLDVMQDYELLIEEKKAKITSNTLPVIKGKRVQMGQLFSNLIGNSLKFTKNNPLIGITASKVVGSEIPGIPGDLKFKSYHQITFEDNGIGFEQIYEKVIFALFQRLHGKQDYAGTGIGLALCKKIVESHGGFINASSTPGKGAMFTVYLPA
jgi:PAS domain S-box-containing protein